MAFFGIFKKKEQIKEQRASKSAYADLGTSIYSTTGINHDSALKISTVFACVRLISETLASLPCVLYKNLSNGGRIRAENHPLYKLLYVQPNLRQDASQFFEDLGWSIILRGKAYAYIDIDYTTGSIKQLVPIQPDQITLLEDPNDFTNFIFQYTSRAGKTYYLNKDQVFYITAYKDKSPIDLMAETLSIPMYLRDHSTNLFKNSAALRGVLKHPDVLSAEARERLRNDWDTKYAGASNSGRTVILEEGLEFQQIQMTQDQAQFIETMNFSRVEICQIFRVPPHLVGILDRATYSNIEQQSLEFKTYTMMPWFVRFERAISRCLLTSKEQDKYKAEFNAEALLRGDIKTRSEALAIQRQNGIISIDEWRELENRNPLDDGLGKGHIVPMNMIELGKEPEPKNDAGGVPTTQGFKDPNIVN